MKNSLILLCLLIGLIGSSQTTQNPGFGRSMGTQEVYTQLAFSDDADVNRVVNKILEYAGVVSHSYEVKGCNNTNGCFATVVNNQQYIVYQPDYLRTIKTYGFTNTSLPTSATDCNGFGLTYCANLTTHSYCLFEISANEVFEIAFKESATKWLYIKKWTKSSYINSNSVPNKLGVKKENGIVKFFINNNAVFEYPFDRGYGTNFGLKVGGIQTVEFSNFSLKGTKKQ